METQHEWEEREAADERREDMHEKQRRFLPRDKAVRTTEEILADARESCSDFDGLDHLHCMVGDLAKQIEILERDRQDDTEID